MPSSPRIARRRLAAASALIAALALSILGSEPAPTAAQTNVRLYGVTGDGAAVPETLYTLSLIDASPTLVTPLGNGNDGEAIGFNPDDGLMYHSSGLSSPIFESIDLDTLVITPIDISGNALSDDEGQAMTYWQAQGVLLYIQNFNFPQELFRVTTAGVPTNIGQTDHHAKGIAFNLAETVLYTVDQASNTLRTIDPSNGNTLTSIAMSAPFAIAGANGLATHPATGALYGIFRTGGGGGGEGLLESADLAQQLPILDASGDKLAAPDQAPRMLGIINPATGVVTPVGNTGDAFAAIAFAFDPAAPVAVGGFEVGELQLRQAAPAAITSAATKESRPAQGLVALSIALVIGAAFGLGRRRRAIR